VDIFGRFGQFGIRDIGDVHQADVIAFAVVRAAGDRLVDVFEPMASDKRGILRYALDVSDLLPPALGQVGGGL